MVLVMPFVLMGKDLAKISLVTAPVNSGVAIQDFLPFAGARQSQPIARTRHRRQIQDHGDAAAAVIFLADE